MMISTKGRYALRVMLDLAGHMEDGYIPLAEIAARQHISEKYLESILSVLSKAGMLSALRGKGGGYKLAKEPEDYSVYDILCLTEGTLAPVACGSADRTGQPLAVLPLTDVAYSLRVNILITSQVWNFCPIGAKIMRAVEVHPLLSRKRQLF